MTSSKTSDQQAITDFRRDGFAVVRGFFNPQQTSELLEAVERFIEEVTPTMPKDRVFFEDKADPSTLLRLECMDVYDTYFENLVANQRIVELTKRLMDDDVIAQRVAMFGKPPRVGKETPSHQDGYYHMLMPNESLTYWIAVDPVDEKNGCLRYLPGSHKRGMRPHDVSEVFGFSLGITDFGEDDLSHEVAVCLEPGDLVVHHGMTVHRADPNASDRLRRGVGLVYFAARARVDEQRKAAHQAKMKEYWAAAGRI